MELNRCRKFPRSWGSFRPPKLAQPRTLLPGDHESIVGTPDGKRLFIADIEAAKTWRYDIVPDGTLSGKALAADRGSDGLTLDEEGNLYLTGDGVTVCDRSRREIERIPVPGETWTANVSFGGSDRRMLFITASTGLYTIATRVRGANTAK